MAEQICGIYCIENIINKKGILGKALIFLNDG